MHLEVIPTLNSPLLVCLSLNKCFSQLTAKIHQLLLLYFYSSKP